MDIQNVAGSQKAPTPHRPWDELPRGVTEFAPDATRVRKEYIFDLSGHLVEVQLRAHLACWTVKDAQLFFKLEEQLSRTETPRSSVDAMRFGRLYGLQKPHGGLGVHSDECHGCRK